MGIVSKSAVVVMIAFLAAAAALTQVSKEGDGAWQRHFEKVRQRLTPNSALPPIADLSQPAGREAERATAAGRAWERRFSGSMRIPEIRDPGIGPEVGPGSISTTFNEYVGKRWAFPAMSSGAVLRVKPVASSAHLAWTKRLVYSTFTLDILQVLKGSKKDGIAEGSQIRAAELGGTIRFPSGHLETFVTTGEGFMGLGNEYFVFLWKPLRCDDNWVAPEAYLIENGLVFPLKTAMWSAEEASAYEKGVPEADFEAKVKAAVAKKVNADY